tara:strand:- start:13 stop:516 length:504 start_codon:yes stop_codon:yes gene_type:complete
MKTIKKKKEIQTRVGDLAKEINSDYKSTDLIDVVCLVNGASMFCNDLVKLIKTPLRIHYLEFKSYKENPGSGEIQVTSDISSPLENANVIILEGIVISGKTPDYILNMIKLRNPKSIKFCAIGVKEKEFKANLVIDYKMFSFNDEWVEGYGIGSDQNKILSSLVDCR